MEFRILTSDDKEDWNKYLLKIPDENKSPHFTPDYYRLFELRGEGKSICFTCTENERVILYPCLLNSVNDLGYNIDKQCFDIQGAYGYNGAITNCYDQSLFHRFSQILLEYFKEHGIIAEFIRFCPVIGNQNFLEHIIPAVAFENVLIDISKGYENIWSESFEKGVRKSIRKALTYNLEFEVYSGNEIDDNIIHLFSDIYYETMKRNNADKFYFFSFDFLKQLISWLSDNVNISFAKVEGNYISTELILYNSTTAYGFLGGTLSGYFSLSPNSFLRNELIKYLIERGLKFYSIGGGESSDSVFLYKKSFSRKTDSIFYTGKKIHDSETYREIIKQWETKYPELSFMSKDFLLRYRFVN